MTQVLVQRKSAYKMYTCEILHIYKFQSPAKRKQHISFEIVCG